jgi:hypothetical protein
MAVAYKLFRLSKTHKGELFPLYVNANKPTPINEWLNAESGERVGTKVKSKLGLLAYRPAWHLSDLPIATHMGVKDDNGKIAYMKDNVVWCECEYTDTINYQDKADERGMNNGKFNPTKAFLDYIPINGFYRYKTNPNMTGSWILAGGIKIVKVLTDEMVNEILINNSIKPMPRVNGELNLADYGFAA